MIMEGIREQKIVGAKEGQGMIGHLFWYSIGSQLITREGLKEKFLQSNINEDWLPKEIRIPDAFRRATKECEQKKVATSDPKRFLNILIREVFSDQNFVQRNVVIETVDQKGKRLGYNPNGAIIMLDKQKKEVRSAIPNESPLMKEVAFKAEQLFRKYSEYYSAQQLRVTVSKILGSLAPTQVRPNGGVYFVPVTYMQELKNLNSLVNSLENSEGFIVPLFDTTDNREMVNKKLLNDFEESLKTVDLLLKKDTVSKMELNDAIEEAKRVADTFKKYQLIIELETDVLNEKLQLLSERSKKLLNKIE